MIGSRLRAQSALVCAAQEKCGRGREGWYLGHVAQAVPGTCQCCKTVRCNWRSKGFATMQLRFVAILCPPPPPKKSYTSLKISVSEFSQEPTETDSIIEASILKIVHLDWLKKKLLPPAPIQFGLWLSLSLCKLK